MISKTEFQQQELCMHYGSSRDPFYGSQYCLLVYLYLCICIYALLFGKNLVCIAYTAPTPYMVANIVCLRRPAIKDSSNPSSALFLNLAKLLVAFLQLKEILLCQTSKGSSADILFTRKNSHRTGSQLAPLH